MATSGSFTTTCSAGNNEGRNLTFSWTSKQNTASNTSTISWKLVGAGASGYVVCGNFKVVIEGKTEYSSTDRINVYAGTVIASGTKTISHSSTGAGSFSAYVEAGIYTIAVNSTGSGEWTLPTIDRESSFSVSNGTLGTDLTLTVTKQNSNFTHKITYSCGSASGTVCAYDTSATTVKWTSTNGNTLALCSQNVTGTSVSVKFSLQTYSGSTAIGSAVTKTITMSMPASVKPTLAITVTDPTGYADTYGGYVQGQSKMQVSLSTTLAYGSAIQSKKITADGNSYTKASFTTPVISSGSNFKIKATATDGRGRTGEAEKDITVLDYSKPNITMFSVKRCDANDNATDDGTIAKVTYSYAISPLSQQNDAVMYLKYKKTTETTFNTVSPYAENKYSASNAVYRFTVEEDSAYDVELYIEDAFSDDTAKAVVPTATAITHYRANGDGIAFGQFSTKADAFEVGWTMYDKYATQMGNGLATYHNSNSEQINPDTTLEHLILTNITPINDFMYILTFFYYSKTTTSRRSQLAIPYDSSGSLYQRYYGDSGWTEWSRILSENDIVNTSVSFTLDSTNARSGGSIIRYKEFMQMCFARIYIVNDVAFTAGTAYTIGTVNSSYVPANSYALHCYGTKECDAVITASGEVRLLPRVAMAAGSSVYISGFWFKE